MERLRSRWLRKFGRHPPSDRGRKAGDLMLRKPCSRHARASRLNEKRNYSTWPIGHHSLLRLSSLAIGSSAGTLELTTMTVMAIGTASKAPGAPQIHPQNTMERSTNIGEMVRARPSSRGST